MSLTWEDLLRGDEEVWTRFVSETSINDIINILSLDPEKINPKNHKTLKEEMWFELACTVYIWGSPSSTKMKTSPTQMKIHIKQVKSNLLNTLKFIENIHESPISDTWIETQDILLAKTIYKQFDEAEDDTALKDEFQGVIDRLRKVLNGIDSFEKALPKSTRKQGMSKPSKDKHDELIRQLCKTYKRYTGRKPIAWNTGTSALNSNEVIGEIIPFLQSVLSNTFYSGEITAEALQKRIYRMRQNGKYPEIWPSPKS
jgi:hypothetical protein